MRRPSEYFPRAPHLELFCSLRPRLVQCSRVLLAYLRLTGCPNSILKVIEHESSGHPSHAVGFRGVYCIAGVTGSQLPAPVAMIGSATEFSSAYSRIETAEVIQGIAGKSEVRGPFGLTGCESS